VPKTNSIRSAVSIELRLMTDIQAAYVQEPNASDSHVVKCKCRNRKVPVTGTYVHRNSTLWYSVVKCLGTQRNGVPAPLIIGKWRSSCTPKFVKMHRNGRRNAENGVPSPQIFQILTTNGTSRLASYNFLLSCVYTMQTVVQLVVYNGLYCVKTAILVFFGLAGTVVEL